MNYISQAIKSQRTRKSLSLINIIGLSICIAASLLILLYVRFELSYDSFHEGERVYRVESRLYEGNNLTDNWATTTFGHAPAMLREIPGIEEKVRLTAQDKEQVVTYRDIQFAENSYCYTEPSFFDIFNFPLIKGDKSGQLTRPNTLVITQTAAHRYFGDTDPIGKILTFRTASAEQNFEVTGVIPDMPVNSHLNYDFLLSYPTIPKARQDIWYIHGVYTYIRLKAGQEPEHIKSAFAAISDKYKTDALKHKTWAIELIPLKEIHLTPQKAYEKEAKGNRTTVYILTVMAVALLIIGWVNALNLTVARFLERGKEFGVRKTFGASHKQILLQGLTEAGLINLLSAFIALGWLEVFLPMAYSWTGQKFGINILSQPAFWSILALITGCGILFTGLYPSFLQLKIRPSDIIRGKLLHSRKGNMMRRSLIMIQFAGSFILITGTMVVIKQVNYMQNETNAASLKQILVVKYPSFTNSMAVRMESFKKQLKQKTYIRQIAVSGAVPGMEVANYFTNRPYGSDLSEAKLIQMFPVDCDYLNIYTTHLACGRIFSEEYGEEQNNVVLNEEAVRVLGYPSNEAALGKQINMEVVGEPLQIIGVVKNYYQQTLATPYKPIIFFIKERVPFISTPYISVEMEGTINTQKLAEVENIYKELFPTSLFSYFTLDKFYDHQYKEDRNFGWIFASSSVLAVCVACLGLWVITLFSTFSRLKEIGIRKVLGAGNTALIMLLTREILILIIIASAVGIPVSMFVMNKWLESYAFHISCPWYIYMIVFILLSLIAFITVVKQVWQAIRIKPMRTLKNE